MPLRKYIHMDSEDDSDESEESEVTYDLENLSAVELYHLQTILNHTIINADGQHSLMAQSLSMKVNGIIASEEFAENFNDEVEEARQQVNQQSTMQNPKRGTFQ